MYVLDTDIMSHYHAGHSGLRDNIDQHSNDIVVTTVVTRIEILRARFEFLMKAANRDELLRAQDSLLESERLLAPWATLFVTEPVADEFDRLRGNRRLKKIGRADLLIAAIVLANRAILVTRNLKPFTQVPNLNVENWID